ncbi:MAG: hypothetical protein QXM11_01020, partial [Candidatus Aenigmatarchaeota archaeon]
MLISAPGKLFIAGEWAILELGNPGIVASINKRVYVKLDKINNKKEKNKILLTFDEIGAKNIKARFEDNELKIFSKVKKETKDYMKFVKAAIEIALLYIRDFKPFKIRTWGKGTSIKIGKDVIKIGFGSS